MGDNHSYEVDECADEECLGAELTRVSIDKEAPEPQQRPTRRPPKRLAQTPNVHDVVFWRAAPWFSWWPPVGLGGLLQTLVGLFQGHDG